MGKIGLVVLTIVAGSLIQINADNNTEGFFVIYSIPIQISIYFVVYALLFVRNMYCVENTVTKPISKWGGTTDALISRIFGFLMATSFVMGANLERYNDIFAGNSIFLRVGLKVLGLGIVLTSLWHICLRYYKTYTCIQIKLRKLSERQIFVIIFFIIIAVWMPVIIKEWPGILYGDSYNEIYQSLGMEQLSTHHPLCHVLFLRLCVCLAGGNIDIAVAIYSVISVLMIIAILADVLAILLKRGVNAISAGIILCLAFFPSTSFLSMSVLKDMLFAVFFFLYIVSIFYMLIYPSEKNILNIVRLVIATIGVVITRKNGIYVVMLSIGSYLLYLLLLKIRNINHDYLKNLRIIVVIGIIGIVLNGLIEGYLASSVLGAETGDHKEALSIPIQQLARISHNIELSDSEREEINKFFNLNNEEDIGDYYYPLISDSAKGKFNNNFYEENKKQFYLLVMKMMIRYPAESVEGILNTCYGYWFPTRINWFYAYNDGTHEYSKIIQEHEVPYPSTVTFEYFDNIKYLPGISILLSIGTIVWILAFLFSVAISKRMTRALILYVPIFVLWLTCVASPVWNELRYALGLFWAVPIVIQVTINERECLTE